MKTRFFLLITIFCLPTAFAQSESGLTEDFENDNINGFPSENWYSLVVAGSSGDRAFVTNLFSFQGQQSLRLEDNDEDVGFSSVQFEFSPKANLEFSTAAYFDCTTASTGNIGLSFGGGIGLSVIGVNVYDGCDLEINDGNGPTTVGSAVDGWNELNLTFDADLSLVEVTFGGTSYGSRPYITPNQNISAFNYGFNAENADGVVFLDNLLLDGGFEETVEQEFDRGLINFALNLGFITAGSQSLFSLILVAGATIVASAGSKMASPGKWKNYVILGAGALMGVFLVGLGFLAFWEWIVAFMLGVFGVRGVKEAQNTLFELRRNMNEGTPQPTGEMPPGAGPMAPIEEQTEEVSDE